jgi:hypothetical protein
MHLCVQLLEIKILSFTWSQTPDHLMSMKVQYVKMRVTTEVSCSVANVLPKHGINHVQFTGPEVSKIGNPFSKMHVSFILYATKFTLYTTTLQKTLLSIISGTGAAIGSKTNFGPTGHHHPRSSLLLCVCTISSASAFSKRILKVVFCARSSPLAMLPLSPQLCQMTVFSIGETREKPQGTKSDD